ncbi:13064_t:CDS:1, partial [Acaulospora morrowiae]
TCNSNESIHIEDKSTQYIETNDEENNTNESTQHNISEAIYITDDESIQPNISEMIYNTDESIQSKDEIKYINNPIQLVTNDENYIDESINRLIHNTEKPMHADFTETNTIKYTNELIQSNLNFNNESIQSDPTKSCKINNIHDNYINQQNITELFDIYGNIYYINNQ